MRVSTAAYGSDERPDLSNMLKCHQPWASQAAMRNSTSIMLGLCYGTLASVICQTSGTTGPYKR